MHNGLHAVKWWHKTSMIRWITRAVKAWVEKEELKPNPQPDSKIIYNEFRTIPD